jgi:DNA mismatch repair protein MutL
MTQSEGLRVERLPEDLVNKIAAGEVVERPASVVKELVENALDAAARTVEIRIDTGGKSLIRVKDDGHGMGPSDARRALERHATSKLRSFEELASLVTSGFRGEALPAIAAVSHMLLRTRERTRPAGTEVEVRHGGPVQARDVGHPIGTSLEVRDLFGEVPARRKFLRADATETGHVAEIVTLLALARPRTGFLLMSGERSVVRAPAVDGLAERVYQLLGASALERLVPVAGGEAWVRVSGFVSRPEHRAKQRAVHRLFVNGRPVRDRALSKAIVEGARAAGAGLRPEAILFLEVPPHMVDVNVHPAKTEVRFAEGRTVWAAVQSAVRGALSSGVGAQPPRAESSRVGETAGGYTTDSPRGAGEQGISSGRLAFESTSVGGLTRGRGEVGPEGSAKSDQGQLGVIGQHRNTYIVATDGEDLLLVDQHTAHERVRFEALVERLASRAVESQALLSALVIELAPELLAVVEAHASTLGELGFDVEGFGGGALRLRAVPALLGAHDAAVSLRELLRDFLERETAQWTISGTRERLAATLACHSAVRAGQALSRESMAAIVGDLAQTAHPTLCPHGRPTSVRIPREDVSRWFGRTGWKRQ